MKAKRIFSVREKVLMAVLAVLVIFAAYYFFVDQPVRETIASSEEQVELYEMQSSLLSAKIAKLRQMKEELEELKKNGEPAELPQYDNLPVVINFLDTVLSTKKNYRLSLSDPSFNENIARRNATVSFTASSYKDACAAVQTIQNCPFMCKVDTVSIIPSKQSVTEDRSLSVSINMVFYESLTLN